MLIAFLMSIPVYHAVREPEPEVVSLNHLLPPLTSRLSVPLACVHPVGTPDSELKFCDDATGYPAEINKILTVNRAGVEKFNVENHAAT